MFKRRAVGEGGLTLGLSRTDGYRTQGGPDPELEIPERV